MTLTDFERDHRQRRLEGYLPWAGTSHDPRVPGQRRVLLRLRNMHEISEQYVLIILLTADAFSIWQVQDLLKRVPLTLIKFESLTV